MSTNKEDELKAIKKKIAKTQLIGSTGALLIGFGIYGMFGVNGDAFYPLLNDPIFVKNILVIGIAIEVWQFYILIPLFKRNSKLTND